MIPVDAIEQIGRTVKERFSGQRRVLSFSEYLDLAGKAPTVHFRNSAHYLRDMFDHYGSDEVDHPGKGQVRRFRLFDAPWDSGQGALVGQEGAQNAIYRILQNFVRQRRVDRMILLHGPHGSSKSTITEMVSRAMEDYSRKPEGAVYRFSWVFPTQRLARGGIGFGSDHEGSASLASFAHLDEAQVDARLPCELNDHPLLLVPVHARGTLLRDLLGDQADAFPLSDYLARGDLCPKCKLIYEALLSSYGGDYLGVLRHVQVERFYVSRRYRRASTRVEPQMAVDAGLRQVTADRSLSALPTALQNISLFEVEGDLVQANRGVIDFADLLKRPVEAFKYLLISVEEGRVKLDRANLFFDMVYLGSSNERHLQAFMQSPEWWSSFRGRLELVRVPYLRRHRRERDIYRWQLSRRGLGKHVAPDAVAAAALWAVLTRMKRPEKEAYPDELAALVGELSPLDKAELYDRAHVPDGVRGENAKILRAGIGDVWNEKPGEKQWYEGYIGASPREIRTVLLNAAQGDHPCLSPQAVFEALDDLVQQTEFYEFLRMAPEDGYHDAAAFARQVRTWVLDRTERAVRRASGLVEEEGHVDLFRRYLNHVTHALRGEKLYNEITGAYEEPDRSLMDQVEKELGLAADDAKRFRQELIARIGAWSVDNVGQSPDYDAIFPGHLDRLRKAYYDKRKQVLSRLLRQMQAVLADEADFLDPEDARRAEEAVGRLEADHGYCRHCALEGLTTLLQQRYAD